MRQRKKETVDAGAAVEVLLEGLTRLDKRIVKLEAKNRELDAIVRLQQAALKTLGAGVKGHQVILEGMTNMPAARPPADLN